MVKLEINGQVREFDVTDDVPLLWVLRDVAHLTGTKFGCGMALCGACTVHVDGEAVRSCVLPASAVAGKKITTIEAIGDDRIGSACKRHGSSLACPNAAIANRDRSWPPPRCSSRNRGPPTATSTPR